MRGVNLFIRGSVEEIKEGGGGKGGGFQRDGDIEGEKEGRKDGNGGGNGGGTEAVLKEKRPSARPTLTNG